MTNPVDPRGPEFRTKELSPTAENTTRIASLEKVIGDLTALADKNFNIIKKTLNNLSDRIEILERTLK